MAVSKQSALLEMCRASDILTLINAIERDKEAASTTPPYRMMDHGPYIEVLAHVPVLVSPGILMPSL